MKVIYNTVTSINLNGKYHSMDTQDVKKKVMAIKPLEEISAENNAMVMGKDQFATKFGSKMKSQYGYAAAFDAVSWDYAQAMLDRDYESAANSNVMSSMEDKYQSLKDDIEVNYDGEEKDLRLMELDESFEFFVQENIVKQTDFALRSEKAINNLRATFAKAYEKATQTKSTEFVRVAYGNIAGWKSICDNVDKQLSQYKEMLELFKNSLKEIHENNGAKEYAQSILKSISSGLIGVKKERILTGESINKTASDSEKELWNVIERKSDTYLSMGKSYGTDEEKYQAYLKDTKQIGAIDKSVEDLMARILG